MIYQLFQRLPTIKEFDKFLKCYNISNINDNNSITYLSIKIYNTIDKLYNMLDILLEIYLPCKYKFINSLNTKRTLTLLRQIIRLFDYKLVKYKVGNQSIYKIEKINNNNVVIIKHKTITF